MNFTNIKVELKKNNKKNERLQWLMNGNNEPA